MTQAEVERSSRMSSGGREMYKRILVPLDGGELGARALPVAERLADLWDAELIVATFLVSTDDLATQERIIARQTAPLHHRPKTIVAPVVYTVADEIADELDDHPDTLVVMATRGRAHVAPVLGSVAEEVLAYTRSPTLLIGPEGRIGPDWPLGPMFVCTDGSATAEAIIPAAADWSSELELHPWVIQVGDPNAFPDGTEDVGFETNGVRAVAMRIEKQTHRPVDYDVLHHSDPAEAIVDHARLEGAGLIALATHGATGVRRIALGSVAMAVVHDAPCPVLVTRP